MIEATSPKPIAPKIDFLFMIFSPTLSALSHKLLDTIGSLKHWRG
jgi:hypothetical protein